MAVVLNLVQWWGSGVVVLKGLCVWGYRRLVRSLVLRTCFIGRLLIVLFFRLLVRSLVLRTLLYWAVVLLTSMSYPA